MTRTSNTLALTLVCFPLRSCWVLSDAGVQYTADKQDKVALGESALQRQSVRLHAHSYALTKEAASVLLEEPRCSRGKPFRGPNRKLGRVLVSGKRVREVRSGPAPSAERPLCCAAPSHSGNKRIAAVQRLSGRNWTVKVEINRKKYKDCLNLTTKQAFY